MHSLKHLKKFVRYNPRTGHFYWLVHSRGYGGRRWKPGDRVEGKVQKSNGRQVGRIACLIIGIDGEHYRAHRLAWWFKTGKRPPKGLDVEHKNRDPLINKWRNLRLATRSQNNANASLYKNNKSGHKGVFFRRRKLTKGTWSARITVDSKVILLGEHKTYNEAVQVRRAAEKRYHGEFSNSLETST